MIMFVSPKKVKRNKMSKQKLNLVQKKVQSNWKWKNKKENMLSKIIFLKKSKKRKLKLTHSTLVNDSDLGSIKKQFEIKIICITEG